MELWELAFLDPNFFVTDSGNALRHEPLGFGQRYDTAEHSEDMSVKVRYKLRNFSPATR